MARPRLPEWLFEELHFPMYLPSFLFRFGLLFGCAIALLCALVVTDTQLWLLPITLIAGILLRNALQFRAMAVVFRGFDLVCRSGAFRLQEQSGNVSTITVTYSYSLPGRLLDYGDILICFPDGTTTRLRAIAHTKALKRELIYRQALWLHLQSMRGSVMANELVTR